MRFTSIKIELPGTPPKTIFAGWQFQGHNTLWIKADSPRNAPTITFQRPDGRHLPITVGNGNTRWIPEELQFLCNKECVFELGPEGKKATRDQVQKAQTV